MIATLAALNGGRTHRRQAALAAQKENYPAYQASEIQLSGVIHYLICLNPKLRSIVKITVDGADLPPISSGIKFQIVGQPGKNF